METKIESLANLAKAVIAVMSEVKGIDKTMTIGTGSNAYKGVPDQEVKKIIGDAMVKNGLCILPIGVDSKTKIDRWETVYNNTTQMKQSVFTEVETKYLLLHSSGESVVLSGSGHGIDSQDKGAGKATTYALKYTLLYTFLVPTGKIDDSDTTHSDNHEVPAPKFTDTTSDKPYLNQFVKGSASVETDEWQKVVKALTETGYTITDVEKKFKLSQVVKSKLVQIQSVSI